MVSQLVSKTGGVDSNSTGITNYRRRKMGKETEV